MISRGLILLTLHVASVSTMADCSNNGLCFGEPFNCDPYTECNTLLHFETEGNLNLYLRNFTDINGYAAFAVERRPDEISDYLICLPQNRQVVRALIDLGGIVITTEHNVAGAVESRGDGNYCCVFKSFEFPMQFQENENFFVIKGKTFSKSIILQEGVQLFKLQDNTISKEFSVEEAAPIIHHMGFPLEESVMEDVLTYVISNDVFETINTFPNRELATVHCSPMDSCFGEPFDCDANTECNSLFYFDTDGNLNLYLRDFTIFYDYAAFAITRHPDDVSEYFICRHNGQLLRALVDSGGLVISTEMNVAGVSESFGENQFRCFFNASELPQQFQQSQHFLISKGFFSEPLVIQNGVQLFNLYSSNTDVISESVATPISHYIGFPIERSDSNHFSIFGRNRLGF